MSERLIVVVAELLDKIEAAANNGVDVLGIEAVVAAHPPARVVLEDERLGGGRDGAVRRQVAVVSDHHEAARAKDPQDLGERPVLVEPDPALASGDEIDAGVLEPGRLGRRDPEGAAVSQAALGGPELGGSDLVLGDVDPGHRGATGGELYGDDSGPRAEVEGAGTVEGGEALEAIIERGGKTGAVLGVVVAAGSEVDRGRRRSRHPASILAQVHASRAERPPEAYNGGMRLLFLVALVAIGCQSESSHPARATHESSGDRAFFGAAPILAVSDLGETLAYYENVLGFGNPWRWEGGDDYGGIGRGGAWLMFDRNPAVARHVRGHMVWLHVTGVDSIYAEHKRAGANIVMELANQPWGFREYRIEDNNGYHLRIAEPLPCDDHARCLQIAPPH